jgi:hypothetical protein
MVTFARKVLRRLYQEVTNAGLPFSLEVEVA